MADLLAKFLAFPKLHLQCRYMSVPLAEIIKQSRQLAPEEKADLVRILLEELDPLTDDEIERLWIIEAERRLDAHYRGEMEAIPGDEVMARVREMLRK